MNGQWIGTYSGSSEGMLVANIDERATHFEGTVYLNETDRGIPTTESYIRTPTKAPKGKLRTQWIVPIDPRTGKSSSWQNVQGLFGEGVAISQSAELEYDLTSEHLSLKWSTDIGAHGTCLCPRSQVTQPSSLTPVHMTWEEYKAFVSGLRGKRDLFRGQEKPWRLRTSFHRTGRADMSRFLSEDIPALHRHLSARTRHVFNLEIPNENGAFFNLVRHHGYPTPLLDWTYSPYAAAFFAYRGMSSDVADSALDTDFVRIHVFDQQRWKTNLNQLVVLAHPGLHLSVNEFIAIENERLVPQQAASTVTNIDDIESYIRSRENPDNHYLSAIDLPVRDRRSIMQELRYMGITAGSLFPGLDGACEELKERLFDLS